MHTFTSLSSIPLQSYSQNVLFKCLCISLYAHFLTEPSKISELHLGAIFFSFFQDRVQSCPDGWAISSALRVLRSVGYLSSEWNAILFYCAYHYPKEIPLLHRDIRQERGSPLVQPLPLAVFQRSLLIKRAETFLYVLLFSFPPLLSGEAAGWSPPASHILPCLLPLFSHFLKNRVFFQVLYSYSILAIKVPSQPFSFTLWLWPFVRLRIFRVNWSLRSPRMLFSFIHSALWMEQPGVGSSSAALHSGSTQSFFFQGPFKIRPKVC